MGDIWLDEVILLGDFVDFNCISSFNINIPRLRYTYTIRRSYDIANEVLDWICKLARNKNPDCKIILLEGNHEERWERYADRNPEVEGLGEPEHMLELKGRKIKWVPCWTDRKRTYKIGNAYFHHGPTRYGQWHAKGMVEKFGCPIFYGHTHDIQAFSKVLVGPDKTLIAQSLGCLCAYEQQWLKGEPTRWQQAFGEFKVFPDGFFQYQVTPIFKHRFIGSNGKIYD
jgi:hypothetical protein